MIIKQVMTDSASGNLTLSILKIGTIRTKSSTVSLIYIELLGLKPTVLHLLKILFSFELILHINFCGTEITVAILNSDNCFVGLIFISALTEFSGRKQGSEKKITVQNFIINVDNFLCLVCISNIIKK